MSDDRKRKETKPIRAFLAVGMVFVTVAANAAPDISVRPDAVGPVRFGMTIAQAAAALPFEQNGVPEHPEPSARCYHVRPVGWSNTVSFMVEDGNVTRFDVYSDPDFRTDKAIRIGDTETRIKLAYGLKVAIAPHPFLGQDAHYVRVPGRNGTELLFETDADDGKVLSFRAGLIKSAEYPKGCP